MLTKLEQLRKRRAELLEHLVIITDLEKRGHTDARRRARYASKLAHVERAIFKLRQARLPL
jgi:hypothetical protein